MQPLPILALLAACWGGAALAAPVQITLKQAVVLAHGSFTFGDVARLQGPAQRVRELAALPLGSTPRPGHALMLSRVQLERTLRGRGQGAELDWGGEAAVRVEGAAQTLAGHHVAERARQALSAALQAAGRELQLQLLDPVPDLVLPFGPLLMQVRALNPEQALRARVRVWVDVLVDGAVIRSQLVPFAVRVLEAVPVARRALERGQLLDCADLDTRTVDVAALSEPVARGACGAAAAPLRLRRALAQGEALQADALQAMPDVVQGEPVRLRARSGAIEVESMALALRDGVVGQRVMVRPSAASAPVAALVDGRGRVHALELR